jgi:hypothetical protein
VPIDDRGGEYEVVGQNDKWEVRSYSRPPDSWEPPTRGSLWFWEGGETEEQVGRRGVDATHFGWGAGNYPSMESWWDGSGGDRFRGKLFVRLPRPDHALPPGFARDKLAELDKEEAELGEKVKHLGLGGPPDIRLAHEWVSFLGGRFIILQPAGFPGGPPEETKGHVQAAEFNRWADARGLPLIPRTSDAYWWYVSRYLCHNGIDLPARP